MKVQIEIEIPDGHQIVDVCDVSKHFGGRPACVVNTMPAKPFDILGIPADWPEWLTCDYVAKDASGKVFGYVGGIPHMETEKWYSRGSCRMLTEFTAIDIPGPWDQSLRENPRRKK